MALANEIVDHDWGEHDNVVASNAPTAKVVAASGGSALGGALGTIVTWMVVAHIGPPPLPDNVQSAMTLLITAVCGALAAGVSGYFTRPQRHTRVIYDARQRPRIARQVG